MHDPDTVAFEIKYPWFHTHKLGKKPWRYWPAFITIWHHDPEKDGTDDSCGWFRPPLTDTHQEIIKSLAGDEARDPWFMSLRAKTNRRPVECEAYIRGAFLLVSRCLENRFRWTFRQPVTVEEATKWAALLAHNPVDNFRSSLCFLSGWHGNLYRDPDPNTEEEDKWFRERHAADFFGAIMGYILRERRPWYRHPRWHIWHWRIQIQPLLQFKRWAFSRCCKCGKGFKWGYAPTTNSWYGSGPRWFRSEEGVFHGDCNRPSSPCISQDKAVK